VRNAISFGKCSTIWIQNKFVNLLGKKPKKMLAVANRGPIIAATDRKLSVTERAVAIHGADEIDLVNSGLEDTMFNSYDQIREALLKNKKIKDLRTAAFVTAIDKIAITYMQSGIFP